jgi:hypothetical protein
MGGGPFGGAPFGGGDMGLGGPTAGGGDPLDPNAGMNAMESPGGGFGGGGPGGGFGGGGGSPTQAEGTVNDPAMLAQQSSQTTGAPSTGTGRPSGSTAPSWVNELKGLVLGTAHAGTPSATGAPADTSAGYTGAQTAQAEPSQIQPGGPGAIQTEGQQPQPARVGGPTPNATPREQQMLNQGPARLRTGVVPPPPPRAPSFAAGQTGGTTAATPLPTPRPAVEAATEPTQFGQGGGMPQAAIAGTGAMRPSTLGGAAGAALGTAPPIPGVVSAPTPEETAAQAETTTSELMRPDQPPRANPPPNFIRITPPPGQHVGEGFGGGYFPHDLRSNQPEAMAVKGDRLAPSLGDVAQRAGTAPTPTAAGAAPSPPTAPIAPAAPAAPAGPATDRVSPADRAAAEKAEEERRKQQGAPAKQAKKEAKQATKEAEKPAPPPPRPAPTPPPAAPPTPPPAATTARTATPPAAPAQGFDLGRAIGDFFTGNWGDLQSMMGQLSQPPWQGQPFAQGYDQKTGIYTDPQSGQRWQMMPASEFDRPGIPTTPPAASPARPQAPAAATEPSQYPQFTGAPSGWGATGLPPPATAPVPPQSAPVSGKEKSETEAEEAETAAPQEGGGGRRPGGRTGEREPPSNAIPGMVKTVDVQDPHPSETSPDRQKLAAAQTFRAQNSPLLAHIQRTLPAPGLKSSGNLLEEPPATAEAGEAPKEAPATAERPVRPVRHQIRGQVRHQLGSRATPEAPAPTEASASPNLQAADKAMKLNPQEKALYQRHLDNLNGPGAVHNKDGSVSTLYQAVVQGPDERFYNIPTVWDGKILDTNAAIDRVKKEGWDKFPSYNSIRQAQGRYDEMHKYMNRDARAKQRGAQPQKGFDELSQLESLGKSLGKVRTDTSHMRPSTNVEDRRGTPRRLTGDLGGGNWENPLPIYPPEPKFDPNDPMTQALGGAALADPRRLDPRVLRNLSNDEFFEWIRRTQQPTGAAAQ